MQLTLTSLLKSFDLPEQVKRILLELRSTVDIADLAALPNAEEIGRQLIESIHLTNLAQEESKVHPDYVMEFAAKDEYRDLEQELSSEGHEVYPNQLEAELPEERHSYSFRERMDVTSVSFKDGKMYINLLSYEPVAGQNKVLFSNGQSLVIDNKQDQEIALQILSGTISPLEGAKLMSGNLEEFNPQNSKWFCNRSPGHDVYNSSEKKRVIDEEMERNIAAHITKDERTSQTSANPSKVLEITSHRTLVTEGKERGQIAS
jgi:hypothetical protein